MAAHNELGTKGEAIAAEYLERSGYTILDRNWRSGHKEIDIVATMDDQLVVVEIKTRRDSSFGNPEDAVDSRKIRRIVSAADAYLRLKKIDIPVRFDIISVSFSSGEPSIEHIQDAFYPPIW